MHDIYWKRGRRKRISLKLDLSSSSSGIYSLHSIWQSSVSLPFPPHYTTLLCTAPYCSTVSSSWVMGMFWCVGGWEGDIVTLTRYVEVWNTNFCIIIIIHRPMHYADKAVSEVGIFSWHQHQALKLYVLALYLLVISSMFPGRFYKLQSEYFTSYGWNTKQAVLLRWFTRRIGN